MIFASSKLSLSSTNISFDLFIIASWSATTTSFKITSLNQFLSFFFILSTKSVVSSCLNIWCIVLLNSTGFSLLNLCFSTFSLLLAFTMSILLQTSFLVTKLTSLVNLLCRLLPCIVIVGYTKNWLYHCFALFCRSFCALPHKFPQYHCSHWFLHYYSLFLCIILEWNLVFYDNQLILDLFFTFPFLHQCFSLCSCCLHGLLHVFCRSCCTSAPGHNASWPGTGHPHLEQYCTWIPLPTWKLQWQATYYTIHKNPSSSTIWAADLLCLIHKYACQQWDHQNWVLHKLQTKNWVKDLALDIEIQQQYDQGQASLSVAAQSLPNFVLSYSGPTAQWKTPMDSLHQSCMPVLMSHSSQCHQSRTLPLGTILSPM